MSIESNPFREKTEQEHFDFRILHDAEKRETLLERAKEIVYEIHEKKPDTLVFLDRGARPLSWLIKSLWNKLYSDEDCPEIKYLNVGSIPTEGIEKHKKKQESATLQMFLSTASVEWISADMYKDILTHPRDLSYRHPDYGVKSDFFIKDIDRLRPYLEEEIQILEKGDSEQREIPDEALYALPDSMDLDGKKVLIIDDFISSGGSLVFAMELLAHRFKDIDINATVFFRSTYNRLKDAEWMPWIDKKHLTGMGDPKKDSAFATRADLSAEQENEMMQLRSEIKKLAESVS